MASYWWKCPKCNKENQGSHLTCDGCGYDRIKTGDSPMTRNDHCTHPNQEWCDCDWCRYLRAQPKPLDPNVVDVGTITEYGLTQKLSVNVRCF